MKHTPRSSLMRQEDHVLHNQGHKSSRCIHMVAMGLADMPYTRHAPCRSSFAPSTQAALLAGFDACIAIFQY